MKQMWNSILQTVIQFVKDLGTGMTKAMHHNAVLMTAGISVVTALTFVAGDLQVGGHNALVAFAETPAHTDGAETELEEADSEELEESVTDKEIMDQTEAETETAEEVTAADENTEDAEPETEEVLASEEPDEERNALGLTQEEMEKLPGYETEPEVVEANEEEIVLSDKEYNVLLRIVQAESGGCDEMGQILVANVILNRVESDEFPDTVSEVVYQKRQFSPVMDGSINTCKVSQQTIDAVDRALQGEDYSEGALYFMNRSGSSSRNSRWFDNNLDYLFKHGDHEFFK